MPYISDKTRREALRNGETALNAGELNYQIFYYVKHNFPDPNKIYDFIDNFLGLNPNYQKYNDMTGCIVRCARELQRRKHIDGMAKQSFEQMINMYDAEIGTYEDLKINQNGDVE